MLNLHSLAVCLLRMEKTPVYKNVTDRLFKILVFLIWGLEVQSSWNPVVLQRKSASKQKPTKIGFSYSTA